MTSESRHERWAGLFYLSEWQPFPDDLLGTDFSAGHRDEHDPTWQHMCADALIAVNPIYENYIPVMREELDAADSEEELRELDWRVGTWLQSVGREELGERHRRLGPDNPPMTRAAGRASKPRTRGRR